MNSKNVSRYTLIKNGRVIFEGARDNCYKLLLDMNLKTKPISPAGETLSLSGGYADRRGRELGLVSFKLSDG